MASGIVASGSYPASRIRSGSVIPRAGLGQEPTLAAPRVAEDQGHRRPPSAHDPLGQVEDGGQLALPPHKAPRHRTSSSA